MTRQLSYNAELTKYLPGQLLGPGPHRTLTRVAAADLPFGIGVQRAPAADDEVMKAPDDITHEFVGCLARSHAVDTTTGLASADNLPATQGGSVATDGMIAVHIDSDVDIDDGVHLVCLSAGGDTPGHFRATADGVNTKDVSANAKWDGTFTTAGDTVGVLRLQLP